MMEYRLMELPFDKHVLELIMSITSIYPSKEQRLKRCILKVSFFLSQISWSGMHT